MKGTGRKLLDDYDETPLQCALKEFEEETQQSAESIIKNKIDKSKEDISILNCDYRLRSTTGKIKKKHTKENGDIINVTWKYKIFYTVLN